MIIRSQKKHMLINMDMVNAVSLGGLNCNKVLAVMGDDLPTTAEYTTKEKALKALDMIQNSYQYAEECKYTGVGASQPEFVFQMPQDSEV